jgi:hypothetical protein
MHTARNLELHASAAVSSSRLAEGRNPTVVFYQSRDKKHTHYLPLTRKLLVGVIGHLSWLFLSDDPKEANSSARGKTLVPITRKGKLETG